MRKVIQRLVTITITETWTIDGRQRQTTILLPTQRRPQEQLDEALESTISADDPYRSKVGDPMAPLTPASTGDPQPDGVSA